MIAVFILVVSLAVLLQFFVSYCRSIIAAYGKVELSEQARDLAGAGSRLRGEDFPRLVQLVDLCPEPGDDGTEIRAVRLYYKMMGGLRALFRAMAPVVSGWADQERGQCAYFAAVALDRRIAYNRDLMAQQVSHL
ncbi:MAG TPA: hypothetical protein VGA40_03130 [Candidatus Acidoferrales bacterium]